MFRVQGEGRQAVQGLESGRDTRGPTYQQLLFMYLVACKRASSRKYC